MKTTTFLGIAAAVMAIALLGTQPLISPAQQKEAKALTPTKWEFKWADSGKAEDLNKLGKEGWEFVTVVGSGQPYVVKSVATPRTFAGTTTTTTENTVRTTTYGYLFKRRKQ